MDHFATVFNIYVANWANPKFSNGYNKCVPIKSNIQVIQTDTPFVILRKHPRFSILQKDENTMNKT